MCPPGFTLVSQASQPDDVRKVVQWKGSTACIATPTDDLLVEARLQELSHAIVVTILGDNKTALDDNAIDMRNFGSHFEVRPKVMPNMYCYNGLTNLTREEHQLW
jgi:hypothetical protein